jgi:hypothetical protein
MIGIEGTEVVNHIADVKISSCCNGRHLIFHCGWLCISAALTLFVIVW